MEKTPKKNARKEPDPRSEALRMLDKIVEEASNGLNASDAAADPTVRAARSTMRLIEQNWQDNRLPEWKVRIWWATTDAVVRAIGPDEAKNVALAVVPPPTAVRISVLKEDPSRAWEIVKEYGAEEI